MPVAAVAAVSLVSAYMASKSADKSSKAQQKASDQQAKVAEDQLDFNKSQYSDWKSAFYPAINKLGAEAQKDVRPDYGQVAADVGNAFDTSQGVNNRNMERFGVKPTDGAFQSSQTQYGLGRALATVGADQAARANADNQHYARLAGFAGMGMNQQGSLLNGINNSSSNLMGAYGNQANMFGQRAQMYGQSAAAGAGMFGRAVGSMFGGGGGGAGGAYSGDSYSIGQNSAAGGIDLSATGG
jgi:hypothetical protein